MNEAENKKDQGDDPEERGGVQLELTRSLFPWQAGTLTLCRYEDSKQFQKFPTL